MKTIHSILLGLSLAGLTGCASGKPVDVPAGVDNAPYDRLLQKYVNDHGLVNYRAWKAAAEDVQALHAYTATLAGGGPLATGAEKTATLINAYDALTIQWILENYPVKGIKSTSNPWGAKRWTVGDRKISLDEIEQDTLRPTLGYRTHAVLVCGARSCPPLWNHAFQADHLDQQLDNRLRAWLTRDDLNKFLPAEHRVELSKIFSWYGKDFEKAEGGLRAVLAKYAPVPYDEFLKSDYRIGYLPYNWSLNEQSP